MVLSQTRGSLAHTVSSAGATGPDRYRVQTPIVTLRPTGTEFTTSYSQTGTLGSTVVSVQSGTVEVADRRGQRTTLSTGMQASFEDAVPRATTILPVDRGVVVGGQTQTFSWTALPGAAGYLFEYSLSPAGFVQPNPTAVESARQTLRVTPALFRETSGTVEFPLFVPPGVAPAGSRAHWRVFPADAEGLVLPSTTASDSGSVFLQ